MNKLLTFIKEAWAELKQVSWLTAPQMIASTWVVIILVIVIAVYIGVVDYFLTLVIGQLI